MSAHTRQLETTWPLNLDEDDSDTTVNNQNSFVDETLKQNQPMTKQSIKGPKFDRETIRNYWVTRFTELLPTKAHFKANKHLLNPFPGLRMIDWKQWLKITSAFLTWSWIAYDFFSISLNVDNLAKDFNVTVKDISWGITIVQMTRVVGSLFFGYVGDRYGRKLAILSILTIMCILEIGVAFIQTFSQYLGVRAVFGILLGGIYGNVTATALDDCPKEARGFISGLLQQGYAFGYLLAIVFNRVLADNANKGWRTLYWLGPPVCVLLIIFRLLLPDTNAFLKRQELERYNQENDIYQKSFGEKAKEAFKGYWLIFIYLVIFMSGFSFMSHGSQDLYPTLLTVRYDFSQNASTVTNCVANFGAILGGIVIGHFSNFIGRRLSIMICCIGGGAMIYPWAFVDNANTNAGAFFIQFFVQGAFGVVPAHLSELSPPDFRAFVVGFASQLGTLTASASTTIESTIGERFPIISPDGSHIYNYAMVMAIFIGCVFGFNLIVAFIGPERRAVTFESEEEEEFEAKAISHHEEVDTYSTKEDDLRN